MRKCITLTVVFIMLLISGCDVFTKKTDSDLLKKPYKEWRLAGRYPAYFGAKAHQILMKTPSNDWHFLNMNIGANQSIDPGKWKFPLGSGVGWFIPYDLPEKLYICWASFVDQTFYLTKIIVPASMRKEMVKPRPDTLHTGEPTIDYFNEMTIGFAPGGNISMWLVRRFSRDYIDFTQDIEVTTKRIPTGSEACYNPYVNGEIPDIEDDAKAWLKKHGMPPEWQEKNNNITLGDDIRIRKVSSSGD